MVEESFPIPEHGYTLGRLLDDTRMSTIIRHGCEQILHVNVILHAM